MKSRDKDKLGSVLLYSQLVHDKMFIYHKNADLFLSYSPRKCRERSGSVVECLTRDRRAAGSSLTGVTALWSLSKTHPSLVLVEPRKTRPYITERLLMGRKESNQTKPPKCVTSHEDNSTYCGSVKLLGPR